MRSQFLEFKNRGYLVIDDVYSEKEVDLILKKINNKTENLHFGVRRFLIKNPNLIPYIFNEKLIAIIRGIQPNAQVIKSIYFDKPPNANWVVNWHQDLTLNLDNRIDTPGFNYWRTLLDRVVVQPPIDILNRIFTLRIHLDQCDVSNGALKIISHSHKKGIIKIKEEKIENPTICPVSKGSVFLMHPLLLHASNRSENGKNRRVIHIEMSDIQLPNSLNWNEAISL